MGGWIRDNVGPVVCALALAAVLWVEPGVGVHACSARRRQRRLRSEQRRRSSPIRSTMRD